MLYVATVHFQSPRWIEIQTRHLREHLPVPFQTWSSLQGIDPSYGRHFDVVLEQRGMHAGKLNHIAWEICNRAEDEDLLMFLDGDAFPIADPMPLIDEALGRAALVAVRRAENLDEPQPHPCFCVTTVGLWRSLPGDWTAGPTWPGIRDGPTSDVGANLWSRLKATDTPWEQVLRSNRHDVHPLWFAVYGDVVYHHGAGFRTGELSPVDRAGAPTPLPLTHVPVLGAAARALNGRRWRRWEQGVELQHRRRSQEIYERIEAGGSEWLEEFV
jgi:hypothetical protein